MHPIGRSGYLSAERIAAELLVRTRSLSGAAVAAQQPTAAGIDADENDVVARSDSKSTNSKSTAILVAEHTRDALEPANSTPRRAPVVHVPRCDVEVDDVEREHENRRLEEFLRPWRF